VRSNTEGLELPGDIELLRVDRSAVKFKDHKVPPKMGSMGPDIVTTGKNIFGARIMGFFDYVPYDAQKDIEDI
jgi:hypothetical protein